MREAFKVPRKIVPLNSPRFPPQQILQNLSRLRQIGTQKPTKIT